MAMNQEGTRFDDTIEKDRVVQLNFHESELPSTKQIIEAQKFRAAIDDAYRTVQYVKIETNHEVLEPLDSLESARVSSLLVNQYRQQYLAGALTGEVKNKVVWLDDVRNRNTPVQDRNNVVSFDEARARFASSKLKDAA